MYFPDGWTWHMTIAEGIMIVYLDNILIFTQTLEEHHKAVCRVLEVLTEHKLFLYPKKCKFNKPYIEYLGLVISEDQVKIDPIKVARLMAKSFRSPVEYD